jgi:hypothetical protein
MANIMDGRDNIKTSGEKADQKEKCGSYRHTMIGKPEMGKQVVFLCQTILPTWLNLGYIPAHVLT